MTDAQIVAHAPFSRAFTVGWEHLDSNGHMANTAYLNLAVTTRKSAATVTTTGGWLDLAARKLTTPPAAIVRAYEGLGKTEDFEALKSSVK